MLIWKISDLITILNANFSKDTDYQIIEEGIMLWISPEVNAWLKRNHYECPHLVDVWT